MIIIIIVVTEMYFLISESQEKVGFFLNLFLSGNSLRNNNKKHRGILYMVPQQILFGLIP